MPALPLPYNHGRMLRPFLVCWILALVWAAPAGAQTATVSGTLADESGGVIPGATVRLAAPPIVLETVSDQRGEYRFAGVAPGAYQLTVTLSGFASATQAVSVAGADVAVPPIVLGVAAIGETIVVTAARSERALIDAPAAMAVIPASEIRTSSAQNYGDLLRAVPGMNVVQLSARDFNVTSRQATNALATSQIALLDGRSLYLDFYGLILWDTIPIDTANIKQIEVVRGPASAVWGANALTGVVNIITKTPRESAGTTRVVLSGGLLDRDAGSSAGRGAGGIYSAGVSTAAVINDRWSYQVSAGYFNSAAYARPTGQIPVIPDPRDPTGSTTVGGAVYPADGAGPFGTAFTNPGSSQPKFDLRFDREADGSTLTLEGGTAGTSGTIFAGTGPFKIEPGSMLSFGRVRYTRGALSLGAFANIVNAEANNLLLADPLTSLPIEMNFSTRTFDVEASHRTLVDGRHLLSYGGNFRRNTFDVSLAPNAEDRSEAGAYVQDESEFGPVRVSLGARVDKFGNLPSAVFSPRLAVMYQPVRSQSFRVSVNRAFRSPSAINNYLDQRLVTPVDLRPLAPLLPPPLQPLAVPRFPLVVSAVGSEIPINGVAQPEMTQESVTAYEWAYLAAIRTRTTVGVNFYINDFDRQVNFVELPRNFDPYTAANPPPGWALPPIVLAQMAQLGIYLPRTAFTYLNLGPTRQKGLELSLDHRFAAGLSASTNYSWQADPTILDAPEPFPTNELSLPPTHRFNAAASYEGPRYLGSLSANYSSRAFWADVLTSPYHGFTPGYTLVNLTAGVKWHGGRLTTLVKTNNLFNRTVQQHVFGDLLRRSIVGEIRIEL